MTFLCKFCLCLFWKFSIFFLSAFFFSKNLVSCFQCCFSQHIKLKWGPKWFPLIWTSLMQIYYYCMHKTLAGEEQGIYGVRSLRSHENLSLCFGPLQLLSKQKCHFLISRNIEVKSISSETLWNLSFKSIKIFQTHFFWRVKVLNIARYWSGIGVGKHKRFHFFLVLPPVVVGFLFSTKKWLIAWPSPRIFL